MNDGSKSKPSLARIGAYAALLLLALRIVPAAGGVVITQELLMPDADGGTKNVTHTMMIEGNRLKTISAEGISAVSIRFTFSPASRYSSAANRISDSASETGFPCSMESSRAMRGALDSSASAIR